MKNPFRRLCAAFTAHPFSRESVDAFLADGRGIVDETTVVRAIHYGRDGTRRDVTPIYDNLVAEKLADQRAIMAPLLSTENLARLVEDGRVDADLYEDLLDSLAVRPEQVWELFEVETGADS